MRGVITFTWFIFCLPGIVGFRQYEPNIGNYEPFVPYEEGFVGYFGDPSNYQRERVNEGAPDTLAQPRQFEGVHPRQVCPGMVGPVGGGKYYCRGKEYGYCDRRSGTCFCNMGYQGVDCGQCRGSHYREGSLCYPKKMCPNDCNGKGECDFSTGKCSCGSGYWGEDCSKLNCERYDDLCTRCTNSSCVSCLDGYSVVQDITRVSSTYVSLNFADFGNRTCQPCARFDPRCTDCNEFECLACGDPLIWSSRRSGYRVNDPLLPADEELRQLTVDLPFGSQDSRAFDDSELYSVVSTLRSPLKNSSVQCIQGLNEDKSWTCEQSWTSQVVCGHPGVISWSSPTYAVNESAGAIPLTVTRTGGGFSRVEVSYTLEHVSTSASDVTATARYTTDQTLVFEEGVVSLTVWVSIHDDRVFEGNEEFLVSLTDPVGASSSAELGSQRIARVTIIDDDQPLTGWISAELFGDFDCVAGHTCNFTINAFSTAGARQYSSGDEFVIEVRSKQETRELPVRMGGVIDLGNGSYSGHWKLLEQGEHTLSAYLAVGGGLMGTYYNSAFMESSKQAFSRVDSLLNFTWGLGRLTEAATDFVTVRWEGAVKPLHGLGYVDGSGGLIYRRGWDGDGDGSVGGFNREGSEEEYNITVIADDSVRLWVDSTLLIDRWHTSLDGERISGRVNLTAGRLHRVIVEYREVRTDAYITLLWQSLSTPESVIPSHQLYHLHELKDSPKAVSVQSDVTMAAKSDCSGSGLVRGIAGRESKFTITPRDRFGNFRNDDHTTQYDNFEAVAQLVSNVGNGFGVESVPVSLTYNSEESIFSGTYTPSISGEYLLSIDLHSDNSFVNGSVLGSPFAVSVHPAPTFAKRCRLWGNGSTVGRVGVQQQFFIRSHDAMDNLRLSGGDVFEVMAFSYRGGAYSDDGTKTVKFDGPTTTHKELVEGSIVDFGNGTYRASLRPTKKGLYSLSVMLDGVHVAESPYDLFVRYGRPFAPASVAVGAGLQSARVSFSSSFTFQARDSFENDVEDGDWLLQAFLAAPSSLDGRATNASCVNFHNGTGRCEYIPTAKGLNLLHILLNGESISGSPFEVSVDDGPLTGFTSSASGIGLFFSEAGKMSSFTVQARDHAQNERSTVGNVDSFNYTLTLMSELSSAYTPNHEGLLYLGPTTFTGTSRPLGDGLHEVVYNVTARGTYNLTVLAEEDGSEVIGSPFHPYCQPTDPSAALTLMWGRGLRDQVAGLNQHINFQTVDLFGNNKTEGGDRIHVAVTLASPTLNGSVGQYFQPVIDAEFSSYRPPVTDYLTGEYSTDYVPIVTGHYEVRAILLQSGGLDARYYRGEGFNSLMEKREDASIDFDWGPNSYHTTASEAPNLNSTAPHDYWSASWLGFIEAPNFSEEMTLHLSVSEQDDLVGLAIDGISVLSHSSQPIRFPSFSTADEASFLYQQMRFAFPSELEHLDFVKDFFRTDQKDVPDRAVLDNFTSWTSTLSHSASFVFPRPGDLHTLEVTFSHRRESASIMLEWESATIARQPVPPNSLFRALPISEASYPIYVRPAPTHPASSTAYGLALTTAVAGQVVSFTVEARDEFGNLRLAGNDVVSVVGTGPGVAHFTADVTDHDNGTYSVSYYPIVSGVYSLTVAVGSTGIHRDFGYFNVEESLSNSHVKGSPFRLVVDEGKASAGHCTVHGRGLMQADVNQLAAFTITSRDKHSNRRESGEDLFTATLRPSFSQLGATNMDTAVAIMQKGHGIYAGSYQTSTSGIYQLFIELDGEPVTGSPFTVQCLAGVAFASHTRFKDGAGARYAYANSTATFDIATFDEFKNELDRGGEEFYVSLTGASHARGYAEDLLDGTYRISYAPEIPEIDSVGNASLSVLLAKSTLDSYGGGGFSASYWNNPAFQGTPISQRVDRAINFDWRNGLITPTKANELSVKWQGYLKAPETGLFSFHLVTSHQARLFLENELVLETRTGDNVTTVFGFDVSQPMSISGSMGDFSMTEGVLYRIRVEFMKSSPAATFIRLYWQAPRTPHQIVPPFFVYPGADHIQGSPFGVYIFS